MVLHNDFNSATNYGIINSMRTGNVLMDVLLAMWIPILITALMTKFEKLRIVITKWVEKYTTGNDFYRTIEFTKTYTPNGSVMNNYDLNDKTDNLIDAIQLYINNVFPQTYNNGEYKFLNSDKHYSIEDIYQTNFKLIDVCASRVISKPQDSVWYNLTPTLSVKYQYKNFGNTTEYITTTSDDSSNKLNTVKRIIILHSTSGKVAKKEVDDFIKASLEWYKNDLKSGYEKKRYMYMLGDKEDTKENNDNKLHFKKYTLSDNKTFDTIFLPRKQELLNLIDNFQNQKGKFSILGFPKQLCILLSGPPGTGKTSLIKAISYYTDRHLVDIPLGKIKSNSELYQILFDEEFTCSYKGKNNVHNITYNKTLFHMEDIDCVSKIVNKRKTDETDKPLLKKDDIMKKILGELEENGLTIADKRADSLSLSGILNSIDGPIDCPGRMIIMTTNHPEKLDPALIRPGRVNMKMYLGYINYEEALKMVTLYNNEPTEDQKSKLKTMFDCEHTISPASLEKLCIEYDDVDSIIDSLKNREEIE